jgi:hypothetical protein
MTMDLAKDGLEAATWHGMALVAEAVAPGFGRATVKTIQFTARTISAVKTLSEGDGIDFRVPIAVDPTAGFVLGVRTRLLSEEPQGPAALRLDVGWGPFDHATPGVPEVDAASDRGIAIMAPRAEIREATGSQRVDAESLRQYLKVSGLEPPLPYVASYFDYDIQIGMLAVIPANDHPPYCPVVFATDRQPDAPTPFRLWTAPQSWPRIDSVRTSGDERKWPRHGWPGMLDELADRFDDPEPLLVATAVVAAAAQSALTPAFRSFGEDTAEKLDELGAYSSAYLARIIQRRIGRARKLRAIRYALQELIRWSLTSESAEAAECRHHLSNLLASRAVLEELIDVASVDDSLLEDTIEALERLASYSNSLRQELIKFYKDCALYRGPFEP